MIVRIDRYIKESLFLDWFRNTSTHIEQHANMHNDRYTNIHFIQYTFTNTLTNSFSILHAKLDNFSDAEQQTIIQAIHHPFKHTVRHTIVGGGSTWAHSSAPVRLCDWTTSAPT